MNTKTKKAYPPVTPGEMLDEEFLKPLGITKYRLAKEIHVPGTAIGDIVAGRRGISADMARRLSAFFGNSAQYWLNMQTHYDLQKLEEAGAIHPPIKRFVPMAEAA